MLSFAFRGTIADIDETTSDEPCHPTTALIVEMDGTFVRVVVPQPILAGRLPLLCVERRVHVTGEVRDSPHGAQHVAMDLPLSDALLH